MLDTMTALAAATKPCSSELLIKTRQLAPIALPIHTLIIMPLGLKRATATEAIMDIQDPKMLAIRVSRVHPIHTRRPHVL